MPPHWHITLPRNKIRKPDATLVTAKKCPGAGWSQPGAAADLRREIDVVDSTAPKKTAGSRPLTKRQARQLIDEIKADAAKLAEKIIRAYDGRADRVLGYADWDSYSRDEFGNLWLRVPREERSQWCHSLRSAGLSQRAIAAASGLGKGSVHRELTAPAPNGAPADRITGTDGKSYPVQWEHQAAEIVEIHPRVPSWRPVFALEIHDGRRVRSRADELAECYPRSPACPPGAVWPAPWWLNEPLGFALSTRVRKAERDDY